MMATARVHFVVGDRSVRKIGDWTFYGHNNLVKVMSHFVEEVGKGALGFSCNLHHVTLSPGVVVTPGAFMCCLSLEVLAACWV